MKTFKYIAKDSKNATRNGVIEAPDEKQAAITLRQHQMMPISLKEVSEGVVTSAISKSFGKVSQSDVVNFTSQLATMITAGLSLPEALAILQKQTKSSRFKEVIGDILRDVEGGMSLASALAKHKDAFSAIYIALVRAGETAGVLDNVLNRLAENLEKDRDFQSKTKGALIYPAIIVIAMIGVVIVMMVFVIPKLLGLYKEFDTNLPLPTRILILMSTLTRKFWYLGIAGTVGSVVLFSRFRKTPFGKRKIDGLIVKVPIFGKLRKNVLFSEFSRTLGLMIGAGIPIIDSLKVVSASLGNAVYEDEIDRVVIAVERGFPLSVPISQSNLFPPLVGQMIKTGEETGKLDEVLGKVSIYFESQAEQGVKNLTTALEPIILIILALGVAFLIISVILPIYQITSKF